MQRGNNKLTETMFKSNAVNLKITKIIFRLILNDFKEIVYSFWWHFQMRTFLIGWFDWWFVCELSNHRVLCVCASKICAPEGPYWLYVFDSFVIFSSFHLVPLQIKPNNCIHKIYLYIYIMLCMWIEAQRQTYHHKCH